MNEDIETSDQQLQLKMYDDSDWGINFEENEQFPNWGSLRRLPIGRRKRESVCKDFWTKYPLKCDLSDGGTSRFKWVRHHVTPRRALFAPRIGNGGPDPKFVVNSRTTHVEGSTSIENYWKDPMLSN